MNDAIRTSAPMRGFIQSQSAWDCVCRENVAALKHRAEEKASAVANRKPPFREGDTVRLRSGYRTMTVLKIDGTGATCISSEEHAQQTIWAAWECLVPARKGSNFNLLRAVKAFAGLL